jgi:hypothetical protein
MKQNKALYPLLESIVQDHPTFKFPIEAIQKELLNMFMLPLEFDYFYMTAYRKLKSDYGFIVAYIFLETLQLKFKTDISKIHELDINDYHSIVEEFITTLERLHVTKIDRDSPDGEMLTAMV